MKALLIHVDGRAENMIGHEGAELAAIAVLTQAAVAAFDEAAKCAGQSEMSALQLHHDQTHVTLLRLSGGRWLRVEHEDGVLVDQVREWAEQQVLPTAPVVTPVVRVTSLIDALNAGEPA